MPDLCLKMKMMPFASNFAREAALVPCYLLELSVTMAVTTTCAFELADLWISLRDSVNASKEKLRDGRDR